MGAEEPQILPSGLAVTLHETIQGDPTRLRFVSQDFDPATRDGDALVIDMTALCEAEIARLQPSGRFPGAITISIADRPAEFGVLDTSVSQSFEAFRVENETCIWEAF